MIALTWQRLQAMRAQAERAIAHYNDGGVILSVSAEELLALVNEVAKAWAHYEDTYEPLGPTTADEFNAEFAHNAHNDVD